MTELAELQKKYDLLHKAIHAAKARDWLMQYAPSANDGSTTIEIRPAKGSACNGAAEAIYYIKQAAFDHLGQISSQALALANKAIENATS